MVCVLGAHTTVHYTRQAHKTHTNDLGKRLNKIIFSMMLNQRKITQHEVPIMGECTRFPWMSMWGWHVVTKDGVREDHWWSIREGKSHRQEGASRACSWSKKRPRNQQKGNDSHVWERFSGVHMWVKLTLTYRKCKKLKN